VGTKLDGCLKAAVGLLLGVVYHLPRGLYWLLHLSYAHVFDNPGENLTASPKEHLKRARKLLRRDNAHLLYAALEIRFALERMVQLELLMAEKASGRSLQESDPTKKLMALHRLDDRSKRPARMVIVDRRTGERFAWRRYKPLDSAKVNELYGRLGGLLHPKDGLNLGIGKDPWYVTTRAFLVQAEEYLSHALEGHVPFFAYEGFDHIDIEAE